MSTVTCGFASKWTRVHLPKKSFLNMELINAFFSQNVYSCVENVYTRGGGLGLSMSAPREFPLVSGLFRVFRVPFSPSPSLALNCGDVYKKDALIKTCPLTCQMFAGADFHPYLPAVLLPEKSKNDALIKIWPLTCQMFVCAFLYTHLPAVLFAKKCEKYALIKTIPNLINAHFFTDGGAL